MAGTNNQMRRTRQTRTPSIVFMMIALAVMTTAAEGLLRWQPGLLPETAQLRLHWRGTDGAIAKIADPHIGFVHPPDQKGEVRHGDFSFTYMTDERGFRNPDGWDREPPIVALGDSQTFGFGVNDDHGWVEVLDDALREHEVLNLGINGAAPQQQLRVLDRYLREHRPETVLFGLFPGNAMGAGDEFQAWLDAGQPEPFTAFRARPLGSPFWRRLVHLGTEHSQVLLFARTIADRLRTPYAGTTLEFDGGEISFTPYIYARQADRSRPGDPGFERVLTAVSEAQMLAEDAGSDFLVVLFPTKEEVYLPELGFAVPDMTRPFAEALTTRGIPFLDLLEPFRQHAADGRRMFLKIDIHPNEDGYALVARAVQRDIRDRSRRYARAN